MNPGISPQNLRVNNENGMHDSCQLQHSIFLFGMISCEIADWEEPILEHWNTWVGDWGNREVGETRARDWGMGNLQFEIGWKIRDMGLKIGEPRIGTGETQIGDPITWVRDWGNPG